MFYCQRKNLLTKGRNQSLFGVFQQIIACKNAKRQKVKIIKLSTFLGSLKLKEEENEIQWNLNLDLK